MKFNFNFKSKNPSLCSELTILLLFMQVQTTYLGVWCRRRKSLCFVTGLLESVYLGLQYRRG